MVYKTICTHISTIHLNDGMFSTVDNITRILNTRIMDINTKRGSSFE